LRDYDNNRTISKAYTVDSGSTWEQKFLNFAGDTTGTLDDDNAASLAVTFFLAVSSTYSSGTLATSWETRTNANRAVGQVNLSDSTSNDFWLTAVQLEVGEYTSSTIPPFQHESYGDNLLRCQRYFVQFGNNQGVADQGDYGLGIANNDDEGCHILIPLPTTMRTASSTITQSGTASDYAVRTTTTDACTGVPVFADATTSNIQVKFVNNGHGFGTGVVVRGMTNADPSFIGVSAEL
jgi:hypothetical protein